PPLSITKTSPGRAPCIASKKNIDTSKMSDRQGRARETLIGHHRLDARRTDSEKNLQPQRGIGDERGGKLGKSARQRFRSHSVQLGRIGSALQWKETELRAQFMNEREIGFQPCVMIRFGSKVMTELITICDEFAAHLEFFAV